MNGNWMLLSFYYSINDRKKCRVRCKRCGKIKGVCVSTFNGSKMKKCRCEVVSSVKNGWRFVEFDKNSLTIECVECGIKKRLASGNGNSLNTRCICTRMTTEQLEKATRSRNEKSV